MSEEYHGHSLYRFEYLPTVLIPICFAVIDSQGSIFNILPYIIGWCFLALGLFLMNDAIDKDRILGLSRKALFFLYLICLILGLSILWPHGLYFALLFSVLGALYNLKFKNIPVFKNVFLIAILGLPYLDFTTNIRPLTIIPFFFFGVFAELAHSLVDHDVTAQYLKQRALPLALCCSILFVIFSLINVILGHYTYYLPLTIIGILQTLGMIHIWHKPERWVLAKTLGTQVFNLFTIYLLVKLFS